MYNTLEIILIIIGSIFAIYLFLVLIYLSIFMYKKIKTKNQIKIKESKSITKNIEQKITH